MAKKIEKIEQISKSFSLENLKKANEKLTNNNDDDKKNMGEKKIKPLSIIMSNSVFLRFKKLQNRFVYEADQNEAIYLYNFLDVVLKYIVSKENIQEKNEAVLKSTYKIGRRRKEDNFRDEDEFTSFTITEKKEEIQHNYDLVISFFAKNHIENIDLFSKRFFAYDIVDYIEKNIEDFIEKNKL
ncbi:hypothetical protein [Capnocytophaga canis]|uniref:hypothetical protein n=1 Tax=Capnocytophaga canis TaxID=1848903 RepID=UPI0015622F34|nr:hypothetical protein [Capnocytophaga canis]